MSVLDKKTSADLVKLVIFVVVTSLATGVLVVLIGNFTFNSSRDYRAVFSDATGVVRGDDVRIAGVRVGIVKGIEVYEDDKALVTFSVADDSVVTQSSTAQVRYRNLVGQRYITLTQGVGSMERLEEDAVIPMDRTEPALDLTVLFNGFKPLFEALSPAEVNKLSAEVVAVFQGEGGTLNSLLQSTASLTNTLADRDQLIGEVIDNLNSVLATLAGRDEQLNRLITDFRDLMAGLAEDREAILGSLDSVSALTEETSDLVSDAREPLVEDIRQLRRVATNLNRDRGEIDRALQVLPIKLEKIGRTAINGSFFHFYLCNFNANVLVGGRQVTTVNYNTSVLDTDERCNLG